MQKVKLNIVPKGVKKAAYLSQNDNGRVVRYELFNELVPYTLDGSETITVKVVRPDGEEILANIENTFEGKAYIDVTFNDDMSAIAGVGAGEIKITDGEIELGSHNFDINVEIDAYNGKDVVIETETGTLLSFNTEVEDNALEYESEIPYNAEGYTGLRVINTRTAPAYDKTPYLFRKTPSGYGNSCIEKLTGLSVAFNQLVQNGNFEDTSAWSVVTANFSVSGNVGKFTATAQNGRISQTIAVLSGHKYLLLGEIKASSNLVGLTGFATFNSNGSGNWETFSIIVPVSTSGNAYFITRDNRSSGWDEVQIRNYNCIDLTQMLGSTIADYIYSLEAAQAGAGVAYFKALFGADYYPYNAGELMSVKTSARKTIGFNQFDEETELGNIVNRSGETANDNTRLRCKNFIPVIGGGTYYFFNGSNTEINLFAYDKNKNFIGVYTYANDFVIGSNSASDVHNTFKTLPINCAYIKIKLTAAYGTTYNHDICINISDSERNGQYEPYNAVTYPLDPDLELRGIPKLDANNNLYGDGDIYESNGDVTRRYGIVDLGSLTWARGSYGINPERYRFQAQMPDDYKMPTGENDRREFVTWRFTPSNAPISATIDEDNTISGYDNRLTIYIRCDSYTDATSFKNAMDGVYLIYVLATPTSESADPFTDPQEARITEEFIDNRAIPIPVGHDTIYGTDIEYQDIDFNTTIFGGNINAVDGVLSSEYNSDGSVKPTPEIIDITPTPIPVRAGDNVIFNSAEGNQTIRYYNQVE